ncbi:MAG: (2Fe-2S) ferredoxin domain-containing protein [Gammaproteobacteria bacterium]
MSYFKYHVFFCTNQREDDRECCQRFASTEMRDYAKQRCKALRLQGKGGVRINTAGCLDRCQEGPVLVVYPEEVWYTYIDSEDIDEIIQKHLIEDEPVKRLII